MPPIKIPNVPRSAYNEDRDANDLLLAHIANLESVLGLRPKKRKGRITEGDAAAYIRHLHRHCHHRILLPALTKVATPVGLALAAAPPAKTPPAKTPAAKTSAAKTSANKTPRKKR